MKTGHGKGKASRIDCCAFLATRAAAGRPLVLLAAVVLGVWLNLSIQHVDLPRFFSDPPLREKRRNAPPIRRRGALGHDCQVPGARSSPV